MTTVLARATVDYLLLLSTSEEETLDGRYAERALGPLLEELRGAPDDEKAALSAAAKETLAFLLREPDEYGYTPRQLVTQDERDVLEAIGDGSFWMEEDE